MNIPFNKIYFTGNELKYIEEALRIGSINGDGIFTSKVSELLQEKFSIPKVFMTTSGTHALEMAMILIGLGPKDEVIMPSYTFPSTANSVMLYGAKPVFAEIQPDTLNIDPADLEKRITENTKAIIPVHYGGAGCKIEAILDIALKYKLYIIEDAAQAVNSKYKDKYLGTWGHMGCYSFHGTKNYVSGEGGALLINSNDDGFIERAEIIRQKGTNRNKFIKGEVDKYSWVDIGSSYTPSDILMALLYSQLKDLDKIKKKRNNIVNYYGKSLKKYIDSGVLKGMTLLDSKQDSNCHLFYVLLENQTIRNEVINKLKHSGIHTATHFEPLHSSLMGQTLGYKPEDFPITERVGKTVLRLPLYTDMSIKEASYVINQLDGILKEI